MLKMIGIAVVVLIAAVLIFAATKPDTFRVQRAASIKAPPERISTVLSDFRGWEAWSPWEKMDPAMKRSYSGATKGKGAVYMPVEDQFWGDRYGRLEDPFGHHWSIATHLRDVSPGEMQKAMREMKPMQKAGA